MSAAQRVLMNNIPEFAQRTAVITGAAKGIDAAVAVALPDGGGS